MKVIFLKSPTGAPFHMAHNIDDTAEVKDEVGQAMIDAKVAMDFKEFQKEQGAAAGAKKEAKVEAEAKASPASEKATSKAPANAEKATKK